MALSKEELLRRRFKVIADYPESRLRIGDILEDGQKEFEWWINNRDQGKWTFHPEEYPDIFRKLEWWEERIFVDADHSGKYVKEFDVMPQFIKSRSTGNIYKVIWYSVDELGEVSCLVEVEGKSHFRALQNMDISTEEEYNAYIQKQGQS